MIKNKEQAHSRCICVFPYRYSQMIASRNMVLPERFLKFLRKRQMIYHSNTIWPFSEMRSKVRCSVACLWTALSKNKLVLNPSWGLSQIQYYFQPSFSTIFSPRFVFINSWMPTSHPCNCSEPPGTHSGQLWCSMAVHPTAWSCCTKSLRAELLIRAEASCSLSNTH